MIKTDRLSCTLRRKSAHCAVGQWHTHTHTHIYMPRFINIYMNVSNARKSYIVKRRKYLFTKFCLTTLAVFYCLPIIVLLILHLPSLRTKTTESLYFSTSLGPSSFQIFFFFVLYSYNFMRFRNYRCKSQPYGQ